MSRWLPHNATVGHGDHGGACCDNCAKGKACKAPCVSGRWQGTLDTPGDGPGVGTYALLGLAGLVAWKVLT